MCFREEHKGAWTMTYSLTGKILLAMPNLTDSYFDRAVILICTHDQEGAMGLVLNHALPDIDFKDMLTHIGIKSQIQIDPKSQKVLDGGPLESARGFLLHSPDYKKDDTISITDDFSITSTLEALQEVVAGHGPDKMLFILGYAGWEAGQLDKEIQDNDWLVLDGSTALIFDTAAEEQWNCALGQLGIDPVMLVGAPHGIGHA